MRKFCNIFILLFALLFPIPSFANTFQGIDVSNWQGYINYEEVKKSGIEIVYIKASQGDSFIDPYFKTNYINAKANGLKVGFYHFLTAQNTQEAVNQAIYFAQVISDTTPDCKLAMDFEVFGNLSKSEINSISLSFLQKVQELTGKEMIVYSDAYNAENTFSPEIANTYPLWIAEYGVSSPQTGLWNSYIGFQYSDTGNVSGINSGSTDLDLFSNNIFLTSPEKTPTYTNTKNQIKTYTVKPGDTLSQIAFYYNTTVSEIAGLNQISNPNLIYPGEILKIDITNPLSEIQNDKYETNHILYTVKPGDTLSYISQKYHISIENIISLNHIPNPNLIYIGEILKLSN